MAKRKITFPADFSGVSIGDKTARIGVRISRANLQLETADEFFCDRRLTVEIKLFREGEQQGQKRMIADDNHALSASVDVKGYRVTGDAIGCGFTFSKAEISVQELSNFSKGAGEVFVTGNVELPEPVKAAKSEHREDQEPGEDE